MAHSTHSTQPALRPHRTTPGQKTNPRRSALQEEGAADAASAVHHLICAAAAGDARALRDVRSLLRGLSSDEVLPGVALTTLSAEEEVRARDSLPSHIHMYIYVYIERERCCLASRSRHSRQRRRWVQGRPVCGYIYVCICIYIYIYIYAWRRAHDTLGRG